MSSRAEPRRRRFGLSNGVALLLACGLPLSALAQLTPVIGERHAVRASDAVFTGRVSSSGAYSTSAPLDLPAARGGLPIPLQIVYGGKRVGAAGMGWDIPISYIYHNTSTAGRRPKITSTGVQAHERWTLNLFGAQINLVRNADDTAWVAQYDDAQLEVRELNSELISVYDGNGRTYTFDNRRPAGTHLADKKLYLLTTITDATGANVVQLNYTVPNVALPGGGAGIQIDLTGILYNAHPTSPDCFKNEIFLLYDGPAATPFAMSPLDGDTVLARAGKLTTVGVNSYTDCAGNRTRLRTYQFAYQTDPDTTLPQLQQVTMKGQGGTPEENVTLPVATYTYGRISNGGQITYEPKQSVHLPLREGTQDVNGVALTKGKYTNLTTTEITIETVGWGGLIDADGDGRSDLFLDQPFLNFGPRGVYHNRPATDGATQLDAAVDASFARPLSTTFTTIQSFSKENSYRYWSLDFSTAALSRTYSRVLDMNGDGRMDEVRAASDQSFIVSLNTPDPVDPRKTAFAARRIRYQDIYPILGFRFEAEPKPLGQTRSVPPTRAVCWKWNSAAGLAGKWEPTQADNCPDFPSDLGPAITNTEWDLRDVNGDGYPDFVYAFFDDRTAPQPANPGTVHGETAVTTIANELEGSKDVKVLLNIAGAHLPDSSTYRNVPVFSAPITWIDGSQDDCGVARWQADPDSPTGGIRNLVCDLRDINGDGIADRIRSVERDGQWVTTALLGTGDAERPFSGAEIALPDVLESQETDLVFDNPFEPAHTAPRVCHEGTAAAYDTRVTKGLRDINGDGLGDYVHVGSPDANNVRHWTVALGTGVGFAPPLQISSPVTLELSLQRSTCDSVSNINPIFTSATSAGMFELDGDGQSEFVVNDYANFEWDVYQLKRPALLQQLEIGPTASVPEAGRLTRVSNGYGATTGISYKSAKEDTHSRGLAPFPEIVVGSVFTLISEPIAGGLSGNFKALPTAHYAYGDATMIFDAVADRFVFRGYERTVESRGTVTGQATQGVATLTDTFALESAFATSTSAEERFLRYGKVGRVRRVTTLSGDLGDLSDPESLLHVDVDTDVRRISGVGYNYQARLLPAGRAPAGNEVCVDMMFPYDYAGSLANSLNDDQCTQRGFVYRSGEFAWKGSPGADSLLSSNAIVSTNTLVRAIDDLGRVTDASFAGRTPESILCVQTQYAAPTGSSGARILNAPAQRTTRMCPLLGNSVWAQESWSYDDLPAGQINAGFLTDHRVQRLDENGQPIVDANGESEIRSFDAIAYDAQGNVTSLTRDREDGATQTTTTTHDPFGLAPVSTTTTGTNADNTSLPEITTTIERDPVTLQVLASIDPNGTESGALYDGFGRVLQTLVTPPGGAEGALSSLEYLGFAVGETGGRRVVQKVFTDPVDPETVATAAGRTGTTSFDALGRPLVTEVNLGEDYDNQVMVVNEVDYDPQGRVLFAADPYPKGQASPYGASYYFNADGTPSCFIRGPGLQPRSVPGTNVGAPGWPWETRETGELYPTCFRRSYANNTEITQVRDAASLLSGSTQNTNRVVHEARRNGLGQTVASLTLNADTGTVFERMAFNYDPLGRQTTMTRFADPANAAGPVTTTWHYDSLGQVTQLEEPGIAAQNRLYDNWGELTRVQWTDGATDKRTLSRYDAYGRLVHSEDQNNQVTIPETVKDFVYDTAFSSTTPALTATNVLGRLAKASAPTHSVFYSYDPFGRINAEVHTDVTASTNNIYVQKYAYHGDGSLEALDLLLPDTGYSTEHVDYTYDSAGRGDTVTYLYGTSRELFNAAGSGDLDVFGRVRHAAYGSATFTADYAETGRRLIQELEITSPTAHSRKIAFVPRSGLAAFDPLGRERTRQESVDGAAGLMQVKGYDLLGRSSSASQVNSSGSFQALWRFSYDPLGNLTRLEDSAGLLRTANLGYPTSGDRDRLCGIGYQHQAAPTTCNVTYDGVGNITQMLTRVGVGLVVRTLSYHPNGEVRQIVQGGSTATYDYDAFGAVQRLELTSTSSTDTRHDKYFGGLIHKRDEKVNGTPQSVINRLIPLPAGSATRHGASTDAAWTVAFGEQRGTRFVTDEHGEFVQNLDYQPFGELKTATGALPGDTKYMNQQWNGGDSLRAFNLVQLGARLYDPVIGRFLSRDPLIIPRTAATTNPYAFAFNDPINFADPTGLDPEGREPYPTTCIGFICIGPGGDLGGGGRGGGGGDGGGNGSGCSSCPTPQAPVTRTVATFREGVGDVLSTIPSPSAYQERVNAAQQTFSDLSTGLGVSDLTLGQLAKGVDQAFGPTHNNLFANSVKVRALTPINGAKFVANRLGIAATAVDLTLRAATAFEDPSYANIYNFVDGGIDAVLQNTGPPGWALYGFKTGVTIARDKYYDYREAKAVEALIEFSDAQERAFALRQQRKIIEQRAILNTLQWQIDQDSSDPRIRYRVRGY